MENRKNHWENIYNTKELCEVSWFQPIPTISLDFIRKYNENLNAKIIDIGGGDSFLAENLLNLGYTNVSVLDISEKSLQKAKERIGAANAIQWINSDITKFDSSEKYDIWHDRAAFHFLTDKADIKKYQQITHKNIVQNGLLIVGTFSLEGPKKCSGIEIKQYSAESLNEVFKDHFELIHSEYIDHQTPFDTTQNFVFGVFRKIN